MDPLISEAIKRCQRGDPDALEPIYSEYRPLVFRLCYRMSGNQAQAADWTQEVFLQLFKKIRLYSGKSKFSTWLYRVTLNYCLDQLKRGTEKERPLETVRDYASAENPAERLLMKERKEAVWRALQGLDARQRAVLILKEMENLSYQEISQILEIPEGTVGSRLNHARKDLAQKLTAMKIL